MEGGHREIDRPQPAKDQPAETAAEIVASTLSAVPIVGGTLAEIANVLIRQRQNRRLNQFLIDLASDMRRLGDHVNSDFIRRDEFADLAEDILTRAAGTHQQAKLDAFRAIFLNTLLSARPNYNEAEEMAQLVDGLQERHIIVLRILADPVRANKELGGPIGQPSGFGMTSIGHLLKMLLPEWDDDQIDRTWADLLDLKIHRTPGTKTMMTNIGVQQLANRLTSFGSAVVRYITLPT